MLHNSEVFNIFEAAAFLGAHEQTVRRLARRGALPAFKVGKDWRFRKEALLRWSEEQHIGGGHCSVLIVDDDEIVCRSIGGVVTQFGCCAQHATSGAKGLDLVGREPPDLILLDLVMEEMNGIQFLHSLRQTHPELPVVIITGYSDSELMQQAIQYAPIMLLAKPVDPELLKHTLRTVIGDKISSVAGGGKK